MQIILTRAFRLSGRRHHQGDEITVSKPVGTALILTGHGKVPAPSMAPTVEPEVPPEASPIVPQMPPAAQAAPAAPAAAAVPAKKTPVPGAPVNSIPAAKQPPARATAIPAKKTK